MNLCQIIKTKSGQAEFQGTETRLFWPSGWISYWVCVHPRALGWAESSSQEARQRVTMATKQHSPLLPNIHARTPLPLFLLLLSSDSFSVPAGEERGQGWLHLSAWWPPVPSATGAESRGRKTGAEQDASWCFRVVISVGRRDETGAAG